MPAANRPIADLLNPLPADGQGRTILHKGGPDDPVDAIARDLQAVWAKHETAKARYMLTAICWFLTTYLKCLPRERRDVFVQRIHAGIDDAMNNGIEIHDVEIPE